MGLWRRSEAATPTVSPVRAATGRVPPSRGAGGGGPFAHLGAVTDRVVVIDTETTGVYNADRVVEVAVVTLNLDGVVIDEWDSLVQPGRDVGPTWIHGITPSMLTGAPYFDEVAAEIAKRLHGAVLCAHNLPFDTRMLRNEFLNLGVELDPAQGLDTFRVERAALEVACGVHGIRLEGAHRAMVDARATGQLAVRLATDFSEAAPARFLTPVPAAGDAKRLCRSDATDGVVAPPSYLAKLAADVVHYPDSYAIAQYFGLLDRVMVDVSLTAADFAGLPLLAAEMGLTRLDCELAHLRWVDDLIAAARADGVAGGEEYERLLRAAHVLGVKESRVRDRTLVERSTIDEILLEPGLGVCFTGEAVNTDGEMIKRRELKALAAEMGLHAAGEATCDVLIAADPMTASSKAVRARTWGIPIVSVADFLAASECRERGPQRVLCTFTSGSASTAMRCPRCDIVHVGSITDGSKEAFCEACRPIVPIAPSPRNAVSAGGAHARQTITETENLVCQTCGDTFTRVRRRGRKPSRCPRCSAG